MNQFMALAETLWLDKVILRCRQIPLGERVIPVPVCCKERGGVVIEWNSCGAITLLGVGCAEKIAVDRNRDRKE